VSRVTSKSPESGGVERDVARVERDVREVVHGGTIVGDAPADDGVSIGATEERAEDRERAHEAEREHPSLGFHGGLRTPSEVEQSSRPSGEIVSPG
jgi:hypothetical protein